MALKWPDKDPDEQLDYSIDWSRYLGDDTIDSVVWYIEDADGVKQTWAGTTVINDLQHISSSNTNTVATIQIALGDNNTVYTIYCEITTAAGIVTERKIRIRVQERA